MNEIQNLMKQEELQNSLFNDACVIIEQAKTIAYKSVDEILIKRNWLLGMRIQHEVLKDKRAEYGEQVIKKLAKDLSEKYGSGYSRNNLYRYISFYKSFGGIFEMKSEELEIVPSVMGQSQIVPSLMGLSYETNLYDLIKPIKPIRLSWTHYSIILQESDAGARIWYENEAANEMWSTRALQRNISSQYYHRLLKSQNQDVVREEMKRKTVSMQDKLEFIKNPVIAEFLGFKNNPDYTENTLEKGIIDHLVPFLMELGKGFAFVDRQKHIHTEKQDYYIDLVFYNYHLQCFVLIDLKTTKLNYQDVGQMDMYVKMYDELVRPNGHNPTIGILLCADTDEDVAHYSVLNGNDQLYATRYLTFMPTKEELRREIERQKEIFMLQHQVIK
ncbi:MAG: DUF1016 domain-containing protein [Lentimicrobiaceae bacterium]|nr:DUF1016 domain-containing protein [Lentimicrobiaceae bacterium]